MVDGILQGIEQLLLARQEGSGEVECGGVVCVELTVAGEVLEESAQFLHHLAFVEGCELAPPGFFQQRCAGKEGETTGAYKHGMALVENLGAVHSVVEAMLAASHTIEESHPVADAGLVQFVTLLEDVLGGIAFVDALQRPVVAALHTERNFVHTDVAQCLQLLDGFVLDVVDARGGIHVLQVGQILAYQLQAWHQAVET